MSGQAPSIQFVLLMALLTSMSAVAIDSILPAMSEMAVAFGAGDGESGGIVSGGLGSESVDSGDAHPKVNIALVVSIFVLGMSLGELLAGPLSDAYGRKPPIFMGLGLYVMAALACGFAAKFEWLLVARFVQGLGAAFIKIASRAMLRDLYSGRQLARVSSIIMSIFIFVPVISPFIGQALLGLGHWSWVFLWSVLLGLVATVFLYLGQAETLEPKGRRPVQLSLLFKATKELLGSAQISLSLLILGAVFSVQLFYLSHIEVILATRYQIVAAFPFIFAVNALGMSVAFYLNSRWVQRFSLYPIIQLALGMLLLMAGLAGFVEGFAQLNLLGFCVFSFGVLAATGFILSNVTALAVEGVGHVAGYGHSLLACGSSLTAVFFVQVLAWLELGGVEFGGVEFGGVGGYICITAFAALFSLLLMRILKLLSQ